jgi:hypothetical protein
MRQKKENPCTKKTEAGNQTYRGDGSEQMDGGVADEQTLDHK